MCKTEGIQHQGLIMLSSIDYSEHYGFHYLNLFSSLAEKMKSAVKNSACQCPCLDVNCNGHGFLFIFVIQDMFYLP
jgi:hypothetical protein